MSCHLGWFQTYYKEEDDSNFQSSCLHIFQLPNDRCTPVYLASQLLKNKVLPPLFNILVKNTYSGTQHPLGGHFSGLLCPHDRYPRHPSQGFSSHCTSWSMPYSFMVRGQCTVYCNIDSIMVTICISSSFLFSSLSLIAEGRQKQF